MKKGFGLLEVMISAVVLGFLLVGLNLLQKGNREAVIRIRTRDAAQIIAQDFIDNLSRRGISSVPDNKVDTIIEYEWKGKNGEINSKVTYNLSATVSPVDILKSDESSDYAANNAHIPAKKVELKVSWPFKNTTMSISEERIIK
jgi:prepilin-type N-terminal cleavage/methylation domain-containing protein